MRDGSVYQKIQKLMNSYVPEFAYSVEGDDPGSVLTGLCADMLKDSQKRYEQVIPKHRIQYLNLFEELLEEPVSASRGYVQFEPVVGAEGRIMIPKGTEVMSAGTTHGDVIFRTLHDLSVLQASLELLVMTDKSLDRIVRLTLNENEPVPFAAFDVSGKNESFHRLYLCFDELFSYLEGLNLYLEIEPGSGESLERTQQVLAEELCWSLLDADGTQISFDLVEQTEHGIHLVLKDCHPQKTVIGQREGYFLCAQTKESIPELYLSTLRVSFENSQMIPDEVYVNGIAEAPGSFLPFGKPLGIYNEMGLESREAFSKAGAMISLDFDLSYQKHEELLEMPEMDLEYKAIMKKPQKSVVIRPAEVRADYVVWEYLSVTGWKRILREEHYGSMFNGLKQGKIHLEFPCPKDMMPYSEEEMGGRVRARLLRAENAYRIPAVYQCPVISEIKLSYSYEKRKQAADFAFTQNCFERKDVTAELQEQGNVRLFFNKEHEKRAMYLGFSQSVAGTPTSLFFEIEKFNESRVPFEIEYLSDRGFVKLKMTDTTDGFAGSGNLLLLIPSDMARADLYDYSGFFLRLVCTGKIGENQRLPKIKAIYRNMAKVMNINSPKENGFERSFANLEADTVTTLRNSLRYVRGVKNPFPMYGGYDGYTEETTGAFVRGMLRTRNRAVTAGDYLELLSQVSASVRRIKCLSDVDGEGNFSPGTITVAVLIEEYEKGMHVFSELRDNMKEKLLACSAALPMGKELVLTQPHFVRVSVRAWLESETMERAYALQNEAEEVIRRFIDPLTGGSSGRGWDIGEFPRVSQVIAALRTHIPGCSISRIVMTVQLDGRELLPGNEFYEKNRNPFLMAVNGEHVVSVEISENR